jgi:cytochrome c5
MTEGTGAGPGTVAANRDVPALFNLRRPAILGRFKGVCRPWRRLFNGWAGSFPAAQDTGVNAVSRHASESDKNFIRQFSAVIGALVLFAAALLAGASIIYSAQPDKTAPHPEQATKQRLAPVAGVYAGNTGRAAMAAANAAASKSTTAKAAYGGTTDGKAIFDHLCTSCHTSGVAGAPIVGNKKDWAPRIAEGVPTLIKHAVDGYTGPDGNHMPAKGGNPNLTHEQVANTVKWMVSQVK